jgi:hypothetical protein
MSRDFAKESKEKLRPMKLPEEWEGHTRITWRPSQKTSFLFFFGSSGV